MLDTIRQWLAGVPGETTQKAIRIPLSAVGDRLSSQAVTTAGLVITAAAGTVAKIGGAAFNAVVKGMPVSIVAGTPMPALIGTIPISMIGIFCFFVDTAGNLTSLMGVPGATLQQTKFPNFPEGKALVGYLIVTATSQFTGGTTALDAVTTFYVSPTGALDPSLLV